MGNLLSWWHTAGCLLDVSTAIESRQEITLFRVFILRDRRMVFYAGSRQGERHVAGCLHGPETIPILGPACQSALAGSSMTTPQCTFTCVIHSHLLDGVAQSDSVLTVFLPASHV